MIFKNVRCRLIFLFPKLALFPEVFKALFEENNKTSIPRISTRKQIRKSVFSVFFPPPLIFFQILFFYFYFFIG